MGAMRPGTHLLLVLMALVLGGCSIRTDQEEQAEEQVRQATANLAADIFEAMRAIEAGVPWAMPVAAVKVSASTIIHVNGRTYPAAELFLQGFTAARPSPMRPGALP